MKWLRFFPLVFLLAACNTAPASLLTPPSTPTIIAATEAPSTSTLQVAIAVNGATRPGYEVPPDARVPGRPDLAAAQAVVRAGVSRANLTRGVNDASKVDVIQDADGVWIRMFGYDADQLAAFAPLNPAVIAWAQSRVRTFPANAPGATFCFPVGSGPEVIGEEGCTQAYPYLSVVRFSNGHVGAQLLAFPYAP